MSRYCGPLLTCDVANSIQSAFAAGDSIWEGSLDLGRTMSRVTLDTEGFRVDAQRHPWPEGLKGRTIYFADGTDYLAVQRYSGALIKLVPTEWGAPTFEIDGIKMLPTAQLSPYADAQRKVALIAPRNKSVLDTCGGLGYFAACCLEAGAQHVLSFEKNADVLWLREINPWSPDPHDAQSVGRLTLNHADVVQAITTLPDSSVDAILHDPPRFGIAGELYSGSFYDQLARVLRPGGSMFHYTGTPNRMSHGRDLPAEVCRRLQLAGFDARPILDGVFASLQPARRQAAPRKRN